MLEENQPSKSPLARRKLTPFYWLDILLGLVGGLVSTVFIFVLLLRSEYIPPCGFHNDNLHFGYVGIAFLVSQICPVLFRRKRTFAWTWAVSCAITTSLLMIFVLIAGMGSATLPIPHDCSGD